MKHPKKSTAWKPRKGSWYRGPSLSTAGLHGVDPREYYVWLAEARDWYTNHAICPKCRGARRVLLDPIPQHSAARARWRRNRKLAGLPTYCTPEDWGDCPECDGTGTVHGDLPHLDINRAEAYVEAQRDELWQRANLACTCAGEQLIARGFGQYIEQSSVFVYYREIEECFNCASTGVVAGETCCICNGMTVWAAEKHREEPCLQRDAHYYTDGKRFVYIGTERARGYYAQQRKPIQIIIEPGRDPDYEEIEQMLDEALGEQVTLFDLAA